MNFRVILALSKIFKYLPALLLLGVGCRSEVIGPAPILEGVSPPAVCIEQLVTSVTIHGDLLSPMPVDTLTDDPHVLLPEVTLHRALDLNGEAADGESFVIPDDFQDPESSRLRWNSQQSLEFEVYPELELASGLYDIAVKNPNGESETLAGALLAVPAPTLDGMSPDVLCYEKTKVVELSGSFLTFGEALPTALVGSLELPTQDASGCTALPGTSGTQLCESITVEIPADSFSVEDAALLEVGVRVQNPEPVACVSSPPQPLFFAGRPVLESVEPEAICLSQNATPVVVSGHGFLVVDGELPSLTLMAGGDVREYEVLSFNDMDDCQLVEGPSSTVYSCTAFTVLIEADLAATDLTEYEAVVTNPPAADCSSQTSPPVLVTNYPVPTVTNVTPRDLCTGGASLTVTGSSLFNGGRVVLVDGDRRLPSTTLSVDSSGDSATAFFSLLPVGNYTLTFENPGGCEDDFTTNVTVGLGGLAFFADPSTIYNDIATQLTIYTSGLSGATAVTLVSAGGGDDIPLTDVDASSANRVRATVPMGVAPGVYHIAIVDGEDPGCDGQAFLSNAVSVVDSLNLNITRVSPGFGYSGSSTAVTIEADLAGGGFAPTPRVYLNPSAGGTAILVEAVSYLSPTALTAQIPAGYAAGDYDVIVINPDGSVGVMEDGFRITATPPPEIDTISPGSLISATNQSIQIAGRYFHTEATGVELRCKQDLEDSTVDIRSPGSIDVSDPDVDGNQLIDASQIDTSGYNDGGFCVVRVINTDNETFVDFSALVINNPAEKLHDWVAGPELELPRRALVAAAGRASQAARYLYAIGGDDGHDGFTRVPVAHATVEAAPVDVFGQPGAFKVLQYKLNQARAFAGAVTIGRWIYVLGGSHTYDAGSHQATDPLATVERAYILSLDERPVLEGLGLSVVDEDGLSEGLWHYRIAALMDDDDAFNPGGESLPSEPLAVRIPDLGEFGDFFVEATLEWSDESFNAIGYRIYRTAAGDPPGSERLIAALLLDDAGDWDACPDDVDRHCFTDTGLSQGTEEPLQIGAVGNWHTPLDGGDFPLALAAPRMAAGVTYAINPVDPTLAHIYVVAGHDGSAPVKTYQFCTIMLHSDGQQTIVENFVIGENELLGPARTRLGAYWANPSNAPNVGSNHYIYAGNGVGGAGGIVNEVDVAQIAADGSLLAFVSAGAGGKNWSRAGYGAVLANNFLYSLGGSNNAPDDGGWQAKICGDSPACATTPAPTLEGSSSTQSTMNTARYLMGTVLESAFIFVLGGETTGNVAIRTTELTVW